MKRILFSSFCNNIHHINIAKGFINMLTYVGYHVDVVSNINLDITKTQTIDTISKINMTQNYDAIIAFNIRGFNRVKKLQREGIPTLYTLCSGDIEPEFLFEPNHYNKILLINDGRNLYQHLFPCDYTSLINYPFEFIEKKIDEKSNAQDILVCVDFGTLLRIIPALNTLSQYCFVVITDNPQKIKALINPNILVLKSNDNRVNDAFIQSSLVIGCGTFILKSLQHSLPSIVVGKNGLGKIISCENFEQQYLSGFQGRIGAEVGEYIPINLLLFEIKRTMNNLDCLKNESKLLLKFIKEKYVVLSSTIDKKIIDCIQNEDIWNNSYKLGMSFNFKKENNTYIIINAQVNKVFSKVGYEEYQIIKSFEKILTPKSVFDSIGFEDKDEFLEFVEQLIINKIIISYE